MKRVIRDIAVFWGFGMAIVTTTVWFSAFVNGGRVTIAIDAFGEMWAEYVMWFLIWPILALGFHYYIEEVW